MDYGVECWHLAASWRDSILIWNDGLFLCPSLPSWVKTSTSMSAVVLNGRSDEAFGIPKFAKIIHSQHVGWSDMLFKTIQEKKNHTFSWLRFLGYWASLEITCMDLKDKINGKHDTLPLQEHLLTQIPRRCPEVYGDTSPIFTRDSFKWPATGLCCPWGWSCFNKGVKWFS